MKCKKYLFMLIAGCFAFSSLADDVCERLKSRDRKNNAFCINLGFTEADVDNGIMLCPGDVLFLDYKYEPNFGNRLTVCPNPRKCFVSTVLEVFDSESTKSDPMKKKRRKHDLTAKVVHHYYDVKTDLKIPLDYINNGGKITVEDTKSVSIQGLEGRTAIKHKHFIIPSDEIAGYYKHYMQGSTANAKLEMCQVERGQGAGQEYTQALSLQMSKKSQEDSAFSTVLMLSSAASSKVREAINLPAPSREQLYGDGWNK